MKQFAVFVDAGYLFAQGSVCISGATRQRPDIILSNDLVVDTLRRFGESEAIGACLLRIYRYDAPPHGASSLEQTQIAEFDDTKLRLTDEERRRLRQSFQ